MRARGYTALRDLLSVTSSKTSLRIQRDLAIGRHHMVAAKHAWAVEAGLDVLERGGNAVDAAVTAAFAIGVVEPWMSGIGGGGFMTIQPADAAAVVIDYFARAPHAARPDLYRLADSVGTDGVGYTGVQDGANTYGPLSVAVPGTVAGLEMALRRFGTIDLDQALAPAIRFAESGFDVGWYQAVLIASEEPLLRRDAESSRIFLPDGAPPTPRFSGSTPRLVQSALASTLRSIARFGSDGFYRGEVGQRIVEHVERLGGLLTAADLASYEPRVVEPLVIPYRDLELVLLPHAAGGITTAEALSILDGFDLSATGWNTAASLHYVAEASRRAFADRAAYVGDPEFCDTDWARLASATFAAERRAEIDPRRATQPRPSTGAVRSAPSRTANEGCTTHLSIVDEAGTMVSLTQTLTLLFGSGIMVPDTGVLLNDSMSLFDPRPGGVNEVDSWKRPASSMAHIIGTRDGRPFFAVGAPGGRRIMDTCLQMVIDMIDYGMDIQSACAAPLIDCSGPDLLADDRLPSATRAGLRERGHAVTDVTVSFWPRHFASPTGVAIDPHSGLRFGGADPFGPGVAQGR
jgi:gamma-glutamyltranspeptidase/glutathione hydrolase